MAIERVQARGAEEGGQAAVALVATIPGLLLVALVMVQFALAGHAASSAANAARAAARASYAGTDPTHAARAALPPALRERARISTDENGAEVEVEAPRALPFLPAVRVSGAAALGPEDGMADG